MHNSINIKLNSGSRSILKVGFILRACFILLFVIGAALLGLSLFKDSLIIAVLCFIVSFVLFLAFFKILNAAFFTEQLIVTKENITVIHKNLSNNKKFVIDLNEIKYFGFADQHYTKHPLDNPIVDFTGLGTQERELQYVIDEGNVKIETDAGIIKFGKNMPSWDVEELIEKIELFTGQKFNAPIPENLEENLTEDAIQETDEETEDTSQTTYKRYSYKGSYGELIIEQKEDLPSSEDKAFLNGKLAKSGKYEIAEKQFVFVSNGIVYAVRL